MQEAALPPQDVIQEFLRTVYEQSVAKVEEHATEARLREVQVTMAASTSLEDQLTVVPQQNLGIAAMGLSTRASSPAPSEPLEALSREAKRAHYRINAIRHLPGSRPASHMDLENPDVQDSVRSAKDQVQTATPAWDPHPCMLGATMGMAGTMHGAHLFLTMASSSQPSSIVKQEVANMMSSTDDQVANTMSAIGDIVVPEACQADEEAELKARLRETFSKAAVDGSLRAAIALKEAMSSVQIQTLVIAEIQQFQDKGQAEELENVAKLTASEGVSAELLEDRPCTEYPATSCKDEEEENEALPRLAGYEDWTLAKAMLPDMFERGGSRAKMRILGLRAAMQIEVERYVGSLTEAIHQSFEFQEDDNLVAGDGDEDPLGLPTCCAEFPVDQQEAQVEEKVEVQVDHMQDEAEDHVQMAREEMGTQSPQVKEDMEAKVQSSNEETEVIANNETDAQEADKVKRKASDALLRAAEDGSLRAMLAAEMRSDPDGKEDQEQGVRSQLAPEIAGETEESRKEAPPSSTSEVSSESRRHIESLVRASIYAGVAKSTEVPEQGVDMLVTSGSEPVPQGEASRAVAGECEDAKAAALEQTRAFHIEHPAMASTLPCQEPPGSASDMRAPPASAPGGFSSMTGSEVRVKDVQSSMIRQESFKVLAALYGPAADQKLAQRQSVSAGSAWSSSSVCSAGPGLSTMSTSAPHSLQPTPPSTAKPPSRLAARAKCRAVRQPRSEQKDDQGSHLIHKKHDPIILRQLDQDRLRNRFLKNMQSLRSRENESKRQEGTMQEYYWRMRDMEAEVKCRKQERSWQDREKVRRKKVEKRRQALAEQSDESLNRLYGKIHIGPGDSWGPAYQTPRSGGQLSGLSSIQKTKESEMEAVWEAEDLNLFQEAYHEAVGRLITPEPSRVSSAGEQREPQKPQRLQRSVGAWAPSKQKATATVVPQVVQREDVTWIQSLRSPWLMASIPTQTYTSRQQSFQCAEDPNTVPQPDVDSAGQNASSSTAGAARPPAHVSKALPAGLIEWESFRNPWRGRRRGAPPPIEAFVNAIVQDLPPPTSDATPDEADYADSVGQRKSFGLVETPISTWMRGRGASKSIATLVKGDDRGSIFAAYERQIGSRATSNDNSKEVIDTASEATPNLHTPKLPPVEPYSWR